MEIALPAAAPTGAAQPALAKNDGAAHSEGESSENEFELLLRERQEASKRGKVVVLVAPAAGVPVPLVPAAAALPVMPLPVTSAGMPAGAAAEAATGAAPGSAAAAFLRREYGRQ